MQEIAGRLGVLLVCMANICRSPMAEALLRARLEEIGLESLIAIDSAGTHGYHAGEPPDPRAQKVMLAHGLDISHARSREIALADFERFDLVLAMDSQNLAHLRYICPPTHRNRLGLFLDFSSRRRKELPDPYHRSDSAFERIYRLVEEGARGLAAHLGERVGAAD